MGADNGPRRVALPLTRWHKMQDRLGQVVGELEGGLLEIINQTYVETYLGKPQIQKLEERADLAWQAVEQVKVVNAWRADLREAIARENVRLGIADQLALREDLAQEAALLEAILTCQGDGLLEPEALQKAFAAQAKYQGPLRPGRVFCGEFRPLHVRLLTDGQEKELEARREELRKRLDALQDAVADLNQAVLEVEVPELVAVFLGL